MGKKSKLLNKLAHGEFSELRFRAREALIRKAERKQYISEAGLFKDESLPEIFHDDFIKKYRDDAGAIAFDKALLSTDRPKFYPGFEQRDKFPTQINEILPDEFTRIVTAANSICGNRFPIFSLDSLSYGDPPRWNFDPLLNKTAPDIFYGDIDYLNAGSVGDSKIIWELSRFQFVFDLGQAYALTHDEIYAQKFFTLLDSWLIDNKPYQGINYCSALEFAFRAESLICGLHFFESSPNFNRTVARNVYKMIFISATFLEHHLSRYFAPNTHLLGEGYGLFLIGLHFPEFTDALKWKRVGEMILLEELSHQFTQDGMHAELSTAYHAYAIEFYLSYLVLNRVNGLNPDPKVLPAFEKMVHVLDSLQLPDGIWPHIGDEDGGRLHFFSRVTAANYQPLLESAQNILKLNRGDETMARYLESFWLLGASLQKGQDAVSGFTRSVKLEDSGLIVSESPNGMKSIFQCGKFGYLDSPHSHADMLHLDMSLGKTRIFVDPGTFVYTGDRDKRNLYRSQSMHNGPAIVGAEFYHPTDPFAWQQQPDCQIECYHHLSKSEFYQASYQQKSELGTARISRALLFLHDQYWVIFDCIECDKPITASWTFITPHPAIVEESSVRIDSGSEPITLLAMPSEEIKLNFSVESCQISDNYLSSTPGTAINIQSSQAKTVRVMFALLPRGNKFSPDDVQANLCTSNRHGSILRGKGFEDQISCVRDPSQHPANLSTDAQMVYVQRVDGKAVRAILSPGSYLDLDGKRIFYTKAQPSSHDIKLTGSEPEIESEPESEGQGSDSNNAADRKDKKN